MIAELNDRLRAWTERRGYTKYRLAKDVGVSPTVFGKIWAMRNNPSAELLVKLADKYDDFDAHWILTGRSRPGQHPAHPAQHPAHPAPEGDKKAENQSELSDESEKYQHLCSVIKRVGKNGTTIKLIKRGGSL